MPRDEHGTYWPKDDLDARQHRIKAAVTARVKRALGGNTKELLRFLNFLPSKFKHRSELIELHRAHGVVSDELAVEWAILHSVTAMRNLARGIVAVNGDKTSAELRSTFCDCLGWLLDSGPTVFAEYPVILWAPEQMERIHDTTQGLAPRLLVALWEAPPEMHRRLRECRYPDCLRPWFVDESPKRRRVYCRPGHSVRTSERVGPIKKMITDVLKRQRRSIWVSRDQLEGSVCQYDFSYRTLALEALVSERQLEVRTVPARPRKVSGGYVALGEISQYRLA